MEVSKSTSKCTSAWHSQWDISGTVAWIANRGFTRVTLQFPDELLPESTVVAAAIQQECVKIDLAAQVSVLADTSYNSLSVDEVAAQHAQADCVVHYGRASMSPVSCLPAYFVFGQQHLDVATCAERLATYAADKALGPEHRTLLVFLDQVLLHSIVQLQEHIQNVQQGHNTAVQVAFANVKQQSLEPPSRATQQPTHPTQLAACSCKTGSNGSPPFAASDAAATSATAAPLTPNGAEAAISQPVLSTQVAQNDSHLTKDKGSAERRDVSNAAEQSSDRGCEGVHVEGAAPQAHDGDTSSGHIAGYSWQLPPGAKLDECIMVWVGSDDVPALTHLHLTYSRLHWVMYDPDQNSWQEGLPMEISKTLKRRYFLVEKAKNANVIGILVGTLGVAGYRDAIESIRNLAKKAGKKTYTMLMGKPNPAKLANFPEVEIFVMVADPQGMILDSKEYYAPIITPYEAHMAFSGDAEWDGDYSLDFSSLQRPDGHDASKQMSQQPRFSLLDGAYHANSESSGLDDGKEGEDMLLSDGSSSALAKRADQALQLIGNDRQVTSASEYLQKRRTYQGLEAPIVGAERKAVIKAVQGQTGRAAQYEHEQEH